MTGYAVCPHCRKFLFEEDFEEKDKDSEERCQWCNEVIDVGALDWRGVHLPRRKEMNIFKGG